MHGPSMNVAGLSDVGRVRKNNEDSFTISDLDSGERLEAGTESRKVVIGPRGFLLALSDGMGGHAAGEVASALVVDSLRAALLAQEGIGPLENLLVAAAERANADVIRTAQASGKRGMGATLTAVHVRGDEAYVAQVGDSRAYLLRRGRLHQVTRDQSLVQLLVDQGALSPEAARTSGRKNVLLQAIGTSDEVKVAIGRLKLRRGDRFLLCCDGLSNALADAELRDLVAANEPDTACRKLIALANERGGADNLTAIVAAIDAGELEEPAGDETTGDALEVLREFSTRP
jgi:serine/threonine protein phosphatase PrpC